jgi:hypothetical protein
VSHITECMVLRQLLFTDWVVDRIHVDGAGGDRVSDVIVIEDESGEDDGFMGVPVTWPIRIRNIDKNINTVRFKDAGTRRSKCGCRFSCERATCLNALSNTYCCDENCNASLLCLNRIVELEGLILVWTRLGYGVVTSVAVESDTIVGEYCGIMSCDYDYTRPGFIYEFKERSVDGCKVVIDASTCGTLFRFANHCCVPNCRFDELSYGRKRRVSVVSNFNIDAGSELTVDYGSVWFECRCRVCM